MKRKTMRTMTTLLPLAAMLSLMLAVVGCGREPAAERGVPMERGVGKADGSSSCKGKCGGQAQAGCWCDDQCEIFGDCCPDKGEVCDQRPGSCDGACGGQSKAGCWCDEQCERFGDCCQDKAQKCKKDDKCQTNADCEADEYCELGEGSCLLPTMMPLEGKCLARPKGCTWLYAPVCGCDGKTYKNDCEAAMAGVSIAERGECKTTPPPPPGCTKNTDCKTDQFCKFEEGDCISPTTDIKVGKCTDKPTACPPVIKQVCGCDGKTYQSPCGADSAGVSIAYQGACKTPPPPPGCMKDADCKTDQFCKYKEGDCISPTTDIKVGTCTDKPPGCTWLADPVCGCDGQTYINPCEADKAGVSVAYRGKCNVTPAGVCKDHGDCKANQYCRFKEGECISPTLDYKQLEGSCTEKPQTCPLPVVSEVCGCDGKTYAYDCFAAAAGVSIAHQGLCKKAPPPPPAGVCHSDSDCKADEFCKLAKGECLKPHFMYKQLEGTCTSKPPGCTWLYAPVCGCDGKTYVNPCEADKASVSVAKDGACS
jgi:hypothetical protein